MQTRIRANDPDSDDLISEVRALRRRPGELRMLVFGTDAWLTWSVARGLMRERYRPVVVGPREIAPLCHLAGCTHLPLPAGSSSRLLEGIADACRAHEIDVVLPVDVPAMRIAARDSSACIRSARIAAVPDSDTLARCTDGWEFARTLATLGIPHAAAELARDAGALRDTRLTFPLTTRAIAEDGSLRRYDSLTELTLALLDGVEAKFPRIVQEVAPGSPVGFAFLARHGRLMAHTAFEPRSPNAWRFFEALELRTHATDLIEALGYHGVGVLEARRDPECHTYRIVALRPGFWSSQLCAERAGMNFPDLLARMPDIGPGAGFMARPRPVCLSYLERGAAGVIRLTALAETVRDRITGSLAR